MAALGTCVLSGLSAFAIVLDVACSSGASTSAGSPGNASTDSAVSTGPASDAGSSAGEAGQAGDAMATNPDEACAAMSDAAACSNCCLSNHPSGASVVTSAFYGCVCTPANCQTQCAQTDCSSSPDAGYPEAGDPCYVCEEQAAPYDGGGACGPQITAACNASTDCVAFFHCEDNCP
jgi:hypothetical protein